MVNWKFFDKDSDDLVVAFPPMDYPYEKLPFYHLSDNYDVSALLFNPGNKEFFLDCECEIRVLISEVIEKTKPRKVIFIGSSMGGYGALLFGTFFDAPSNVILSFSPFLRLDNLGSISQQNITPELLSSGSIINQLNNITCSAHLFFPCVDRQDGAHMIDSDLISNPNVEKHFLMTAHDIGLKLPFMNVLESILRDGDIPRSDVSKILASEEDVHLSRKTYLIYKAEILKSKDIEFNDHSPVESTDNYLYFYWKARYLHTNGFPWKALENFNKAIALGGDKVFEIFFCTALVFKSLGFYKIALGYFEQALLLDPANLSALKNIEQLKKG